MDRTDLRGRGMVSVVSHAVAGRVAHINWYYFGAERLCCARVAHITAHGPPPVEGPPAGYAGAAGRLFEDRVCWPAGYGPRSRLCRAGRNCVIFYIRPPNLRPGKSDNKDHRDGTDGSWPFSTSSAAPATILGSAGPLCSIYELRQQRDLTNADPWISWSSCTHAAPAAQ